MFSIVGAISALGSLLSGAPQIVKDITGHLSARVNATRDADIARIKSGEAVALKQEETQAVIATLQQALNLADQRWWATRWIRPGFAYLCMFHFALVVLASGGYIKGPIAALPYPMDWLEAGIIGAYFLLRPLEKWKPKT